MLNPIQIQDEYIKTMSVIAPSNRAYCVVLSKAGKKLTTALLGLGFTQSETDKFLYDAHDQMKLESASL